MASGATQKVLAIPELLERILLELPVKDMLLSQRVSTAFQDVVTDSNALQRALFLHQSANYQDSDDVPILNPLITRNHGSKRFEDARIFHVKGRNYFVGPPAARNATNPLPVIEVEDGGIWHLHLEIKEVSGAPTENKNSPCTSSSSTTESSWACMFLSQPVCDIHVYEVDHDAQMLVSTYEVAGGTLHRILEDVISEKEYRRRMQRDGSS